MKNKRYGVVGYIGGLILLGSTAVSAAQNYISEDFWSNPMAKARVDLPQLVSHTPMTSVGQKGTKPTVDSIRCSDNARRDYPNHCKLVDQYARIGVFEELLQTQDARREKVFAAIEDFKQKLASAFAQALEKQGIETKVSKVELKLIDGFDVISGYEKKELTWSIEGAEKEINVGDAKNQKIAIKGYALHKRAELKLTMADGSVLASSLKMGSDQRVITRDRRKFVGRTYDALGNILQPGYEEVKVQVYSDHVSRFDSDCEGAYPYEYCLRNAGSGKEILRVKPDGKSWSNFYRHKEFDLDVEKSGKF